MRDWLILGLAIALMVRKKPTPPSSPAKTIAKKPPAAPPRFGFVYRHESEPQYRLRVGSTFGSAVERGSFDTRAKAEAVARELGASPQWAGEIPG